MAKERFRDIELASLSAEDLSHNMPDPSLYAKSSPAQLNACDAFISHSWHDDAPAKWAALQRWRRNFVEQHGREPRGWLDKCCLNQNSIEEDLKCLPVFLAGCRKIVVFCGPTYLHRLWCILEIFTFVHMGRNLQNLELEVITREHRFDEDLFAIDCAFDDFDAECCRCHNTEDKERMLGIIYAAFGSMRAFNEEVTSILRATHLFSRSGDDVAKSECSEGIASISKSSHSPCQEAHGADTLDNV